MVIEKENWCERLENRQIARKKKTTRHSSQNVWLFRMMMHRSVGAANLAEVSSLRGILSGHWETPRLWIFLRAMPLGEYRYFSSIFDSMDVFVKGRSTKRDWCLWRIFVAYIGTNKIMLGIEGYKIWFVSTFLNSYFFNNSLKVDNILSLSLNESWL